MTIWAIGRQDLNLTEDEFWGLTFKEFDALLKRQAANIERQDFRAGLICAVLANINRDPKKSKVFTPQDFMPSKPKPAAPAQNPEEMFELINLIYGAQNGN